MTILAGIYCRQNGSAITDSLCDRLRSVLSRNSDDDVIEFRDDRCFIGKVDIGAFAAPAARLGGAGPTSLLVGDPLLDIEQRDTRRTRTQDLDVLHNDWRRGDWNTLAKSRGAFCAAHYDPESGQIKLITDKLGLRSVYYWISENHIIFSSVLRILESLHEVSKVMDLRGVTEACHFGPPFCGRTAYDGIFRLQAAEILSANGETLSLCRYFRLDEIAESDQPLPVLLAKGYQIFRKAVADRIGSDTSTIALLSGGLDSRCVVAVLRDLGADLHSFNYAPMGSQDQILGREFARVAGTIHEEMPLPSSAAFPDVSRLMADAWNRSTRRGETPVDRPQVVWTGDPGSFSVGYVSLKKNTIELMRAGKVEEAISDCFPHGGVCLPLRVITPPFRRELAQIPRAGMLEAINSFDCPDPGRKIFLSHLLNESRYQLFNHFETIDLHRFEFLTPLWDVALIEFMMTVPMDYFFGHVFYHEWLKLFPPSTTAVPWQTYPGHEPCPLPIPENLPTQWDMDISGVQKRILSETVRMILSKDWPSSILNRYIFALYILAYCLRPGDYSYVVKRVKLFFDHYVVSEGRYALLPSD